MLDKAKTIFTCGYGNSTSDEFLARLKAAGVDLVIDVRRKKSKGWCSSYDAGRNMRNYLLLDGGIAYIPWIWLANKCSSLSQYKNWLNNEGMESVAILAESVKNAVENNDRTCCLLCAEGDPFEKDGVTPRCHRVYVADALVKLLGDGWEICHL